MTAVRFSREMDSVSKGSGGKPCGKERKMFRYIFRDGAEILTPKGLPLQAIEAEEAKHGELEMIREVKNDPVGSNGKG